MPSFKKYSKASLESHVDRLFTFVKEYRDSEQFKQMLKFCARFKRLSPYNAFLVQQQCPSARYVLTAEEWSEKYQRLPKPNARPLIILIPFGPVSFVYEIGDTHHDYSKGGSYGSDDEILKELESPYQTKGTIDSKVMTTFIEHLAYNSIALDTDFRAGAEYGAQIRLTKQTDKCLIKPSINKYIKLSEEAKFLISINKNADRETQFASICHELAHLFCYHLTCPFTNGWEVRDIGYDAKEFEAETASWLVCERMNIVNPSEKYLSWYLSVNKYIPDTVSIDRIFFAVNSILDMTEKMGAKDGMLYAFDRSYKDKVDKIFAASKRTKPVQLSLF